jgi:hypothetical protein
MSVVYRNDRNGLEDFVDGKIGDCSEIAKDYVELMYGEEEAEKYEEEIDSLVKEYSNSFSGELSRPDFFEKVKPELDELLSE